MIFSGLSEKERGLFNLSSKFSRSFFYGKLRPFGVCLRGVFVLEKSLVMSTWRIIPGLVSG